MANLFWGVSDALDLYSEYINAKNQKVQKPEIEAKKKAEKDIVQATTDEEKTTTCGNTEIIVPDVPDGYAKSKQNPKESKDREEIVEDSGSEKHSDAENNCLNPSDGDLRNEAATKNSAKNTEIPGDVVELSEDIHIVGGKNDVQTHIASSEDVTEDNEELNVLQDIYATKLSKNSYNTIDNAGEEIGSSESSKKQRNTSHDFEQKQPKDDQQNDNKNNIDREDLKNGTEIRGNMCDAESMPIENKDSLTDIKDTDKTICNDESTHNLENLSDTEKLCNSCPNTERLTAGEELKSNANEDNSGLLPNDLNCTTEESSDDTAKRTLNILIFGGGDPRHIIKTMAKRYTHCENEGTASSVPILKFYIIEGCMEIIARNIALLGIALERPELISLRNKVHLFMDVYGNSLLRPICHQYLVSKAATLLKMVSDKDTLNKIAPFIHFDGLKYRELDALQDAFEFWQPKPGYDFNIKDYWLSRLRRLLAVRYDAREGVFDWDLNMSLKDRGCQQICSQEYRYWRETGIAFTYPEYEQCKPNKTLSAGLVRNGGRYLHRGYIGDIQTGPFCTFGLRSMEERMHHSAHGENDYRATDVTERNLLEFFHEIQNGTAYVHNSALSQKYGGVRFQMGERLIHNECDMKGICAYDQPWINVEGIEVHFLPLQEVKEIAKGVTKWQNFFNIAFVGYKYFEFLTDTFPSVLREDSLLILETKLRSVEVKNRIAEFETELHGFARDAKLLNVLNYGALNSKNSILKFWKPSKIVQDNMQID